MKKLTKAEERLRRINPKRYRELVQRRKQSSAFKTKQSESRKGKQIKKTTTETPRDTQTKAAALAAVSMIPGAGKIAAAIRALAAGERLTRGLQNRVDKLLTQYKPSNSKAVTVAKPKTTSVAKPKTTAVAKPKTTTKSKTKLPKSGATGKAVAATLGIAGASTPAKKPKKEAEASPISNIPTPKRKPTPPSGTKVDYSPSRAIPKMDKPKAKPKDDAMTIKEYVKGAVGMKGAKGMEGGVRKVKTPFGVIEVDSSEEAFSNNKYGGQVKRNIGGKVRGVGKAIKGFGNANYSDKMY